MNTSDSIVTYRDIAGHPGYRVGDDGSVWSRWVKGRGSARMRDWRRMKTSTSYGYIRVNISGRHQLVHVLVLEAFVGPRPAGMVTRHYPDRDRSNNRLANLQWGTHEDNAKDKLFHGTLAVGEKSGSAKLTEEQVKSIRREYAEGGVTQAVLSEKYQISKFMVGWIVRRKGWKHLE